MDPHLGEAHEMQNQSSAERLLCRRRLYQADVQHCSPPALSNASSGFVLFKSLSAYTAKASGCGPTTAGKTAMRRYLAYAVARWKRGS